ncbi:hypothetical protein [Blastochloris sulfoviridis]|uniref:Uncharacterized protein n=1 Tax=Blastochloris sulfoviridis TaxID=50712 RepID=A0A5M6HNR7_9HYPH|nr:hypothetical protein [Blastochloris sulfoviridis]KAA5597249.1 hypothetical protein F1193_14675 [Blastochloris sulfoviridis]
MSFTNDAMASNNTMTKEYANYKVKSPKGKIYVYPYRQFCIKLSPADAEYIDSIIERCSEAKGKRVTLPPFFMQLAKHYECAGNI